MEFYPQTRKLKVHDDIMHGRRHVFYRNVKDKKNHAPEAMLIPIMLTAEEVS